MRGNFLLLRNQLSMFIDSYGMLMEFLIFFYIYPSNLNAVLSSDILH